MFFDYVMPTGIRLFHEQIKSSHQPTNERMIFTNGVIAANITMIVPNKVKLSELIAAALGSTLSKCAVETAPQLTPRVTPRDTKSDFRIRSNVKEIQSPKKTPSMPDRIVVTAMS